MAISPLDAQLQLIRKHAAAGDADALYALGFPARFGEDTLPDAVGVWRKAAARGSGSAAIELADCIFAAGGACRRVPHNAYASSDQPPPGKIPRHRPQR